MKDYEESNKKVSDTLQKELYSLRKGDGLTIAKLEHLSLLPKIIARTTGMSLQHTSIEQLQTYIIHEIDTLPNGVEAMALNNAFALGWKHPETLTKRRQALAQKLDKHADTIEAYENRAITTLARRLTSYVPRIATADTPSQEAFPQPENHFEGAMRSLLSKGLGELLQINTHETELLRCFTPNIPPYIDTSIEWLLLPSSRGSNWYSHRIRYTFRRKKEFFRIAITSSSLNSEALMVSGLVDEVIKLDRSPHNKFEISDILQSTRFVVKEISGRQQLYSFAELDPLVTQQLLAHLWQIDKSDCRIIEVQLPKEKVTDDTIFEYWLTYHLRLKEQYAYWYAPSLMFLNNIILDVSRFPGRKDWDFHILPFFGHVFPGTIEPTGDRFTMPANSWIMQGHGIALSWQKRQDDQEATVA